MRRIDPLCLLCQSGIYECQLLLSVAPCACVCVCVCITVNVLFMLKYELNQPIEKLNDMLPCSGQRGLNAVIVPRVSRNAAAHRRGHQRLWTLVWRTTLLPWQRTLRSVSPPPSQRSAPAHSEKWINKQANKNSATCGGLIESLYCWKGQRVAASDPSQLNRGPSR